jgi:hypothetical protein
MRRVAGRRDCKQVTVEGEPGAETIVRRPRWDTCATLRSVVRTSLERAAVALALAALGSCGGKSGATANGAGSGAVGASGGTSAGGSGAGGSGGLGSGAGGTAGQGAGQSGAGGGGGASTRGGSSGASGAAGKGGAGSGGSAGKSGGAGGALGGAAGNEGGGPGQGGSGEASGSAGAGGTGATTSGAECRTADDCMLVSDCCSCRAEAKSSEIAICDAECFVDSCTSEQITDTEVTCSFGRCVLARSCDRSQVTCRAAPPPCDGGTIPSVLAGCWGPCLAPTECRNVTGCDDCGIDAVCVNDELLAPTSGSNIGCVAPGGCSVGDYCKCLGACSVSCNETANQVNCYCPQC